MDTGNSDEDDNENEDGYDNFEHIWSAYYVLGTISRILYILTHWLFSATSHFCHPHFIAKDMKAQRSNLSESR